MMKEKQNVLLISDTNFVNVVKDYKNYYEKLNKFLIDKNEQKEVVLHSVSGKYCFDDKLMAIPIEDKNKTSFVRSIGDYLNRFDEIVIISNYAAEPFLGGLRAQLNEENKPTTVFTYEVKDEVIES